MNLRRGSRRSETTVRGAENACHHAEALALRCDDAAGVLGARDAIEKLRHAVEDVAAASFEVALAVKPRATDS